MAHPPEKRMELRSAYIGGLPLEAAADKTGVPYATARNWFRAAREEGDDWDKFRAASLIVAGGGIEQAMGRIIAAGLMRCEALLERVALLEDPNEAVKAMAILGDTVSKLRAAGKSMMPEADKLGVAMDVIKRLIAYLRENHPQQADAFAELLPVFGDELARAYG
ncbi:DUF1804 family protein [Azonexus sp.]|uniref:DUF1804 family protein n=1 Tax=Azonexus sp. TaxID=1872668 RepID=UPI0027B88D46|nr:DUF1804 family protein [Azonexus sp.]